MTQTDLYFVRHGETLWNQEKRMQGQLNSALTQIGKKQAQLLGEKLKNENFNACYRSESLRVAETFSLMAENLPLQALITPALQEIKMGTWEGQLAEKIQQQAPQEWQNFWQEPTAFQALNGGETFQELKKRTDLFLAQLAQQHQGEKVLIISHRLTIKTMINSLLDRSLTELTQLADIAPNSLSHVRLVKPKNKLIRYSDISHYQKKA